VKKPKLRELKEAIRAVIVGPYTTKFPAEPYEAPDGFRGRPKYNEQTCVGCGACAEVCPALAIDIVDDPEADPPTRKLVQKWDKCIFCGQCELNCTTTDGIQMSKEWDLATLDRSTCREVIEHDLVICEVCGAIVGTIKHLRWIAERLGAKAYANPTLIVAADGSMRLAARDGGRGDEPTLARSDMMRIQCPDCRRTTIVRELWGE
jgi:hydrogenase-4 component H